MVEAIDRHPADHRGAMGLIRAIFRRGRMERDMDTELRAHIEMHIEENRRAGMPEEQAREEAFAAFGRVDNIKENCRDQTGISWRESVVQDTRFALRLMRKAPAFAFLCALTLALGTGAATAIYSVVQAVLIRPLRLPDPDRLVYVWENDRKRNTTRENASLPDFIDLERQAQSYAAMAAYNRVNLTLTGFGDAERVAGARVSG